MMKKILFSIFALALGFGLAFTAYTVNTDRNRHSTTATIPKNKQQVAPAIEKPAPQQVPGGVSDEAVKKLKLK